ncbi:acyltransferase family protein [Yaniella halotolerans]|uniref:acyltransferase family protein n=1 Tax=Yaniella halotolerans TaxID=225453 RepID=UPI0003B416F0|nr:acyltransferase [Yaniella halotolerans]
MVSNVSIHEIKESKKRVLWLDFAKAFAIIAVVVTHVITKFLIPLDFRSSEILVAFIVAFQPLRMPVFFLVSGLLGASALIKPWRVVLTRKTASYYYIYVIWLVLQTVSFSLFPNHIVIPTVVANDLVSIFAQLTYDPSNLWYLWALALFFPIAKMGLRLPRAAIVASLLLATLAAMGLFSELGLASAALLNLPWFLLGSYFSSSLMSFVDSRQSRRIWLSIFCFAFLLAGYLGIRVAFGSLFSGLIYNIVAFAGLIMIVYLFPRLATILRRCKLLSSLVVYIGRNTVQIYVLHVPIITLVGYFAGSLTGSLIMALLMAIITSIIVIAASLVAGSVLQRLIPFIFSPPKWISGVS